jgi:Cytochrome c7 and related cytochrome c
MKRIFAIAAVAALALFAPAARAAAPKGPTAVTKSASPAKNGPVTFDHGSATHKAQKCTDCHENDKGGKIAGMDQKKAHAHCQKCHIETAKADPSKKALQTCTTCHAKK